MRRRLLFALVAPTLGAPAWTATAGILTLTVNPDDSYSVSTNGATLLVSGFPSFHVNGSWWVTAGGAPSPGSTCSNLTDVDCHGDDLYFFNTSSVEDCCANCSASTSCGAWTYTGDTLTAPPPAWAHRCYIKTSCAGKIPYAGHTSGEKPRGDRVLARVGAGPVSGAHPALGAFTGWEVRYAAGGTPVTTTFLSFPAGAGLFMFNTTLPAGAGGMALLAPGGPGGGGEFASSQQPSTQFPVFDAPGLRYVSWGGRFFGDSAGAWGAGATAGAMGGPVAFFPPQAAPGAFPALVVAPFNAFKSNMFGAPLSGQGGTLAAGLNGYVGAVPAGFTLSTSVSGSAAGATDALHAWGGALLAARGTVRVPCPASSVLSYWTDNGAFYDFYAYEPDITSAGVPQDILGALAETFRNGSYARDATQNAAPPLPVKMFMLDAYWMYNVRSNGNCKVNDTVWPLPFPRGLAALAQDVGPLIIYNGPQCGNTTYAGAWPLEMSLYWDQGWGKGYLSAIAANASKAFYAATFADLKAQGMGSFTQDFLDFQGLLFPGFLASPTGNAEWMRGQADAALEAGLAVQYCMALPADILQSVEFPAVTNARASQDYGAGGRNYEIWGASLLLSALGLRASKDNFWTGPANSRGHETSPFLVAAVAALSGGPVGFADPLFGTNPAVLWPTCTANGTLLHASRPATLVDSHWSGVPAFAGWAVAAAHCALSPTTPLRAYSVLAESQPQLVPQRLALADLWPPPAPVPGVTAGATPRFYLWAFNASACTRGGAAGACVVELGAGAPPPPPPPPNGDRVAWGLWNAAPVLANGYALLGETDKYVACSPERFADVGLGAGGAGVGATLRGAPGEAVHVAFYRPGAEPVIVVQTLTLNSSGGLSAQLL